MPFSKNNGCVVFLPRSYDKAKQWPCIILLHGRDERGDGTDRGLDNLLNFLTFQWNNIQSSLDKYDKYILIAPQLPATLWAWGVQRINDAIDFALANYSVNPKRLYLTWISLGGSGGWQYLSIPGNSQKFAAAAGICGVQGWSDAKELQNIKCPVWGFHEADDPVVSASVTITAIDAINSGNPPVKAHKTIYPASSPMDHFIWAKVFDSNSTPGIAGETVNLYEWFDLNEQGSPVAVPTTITPNPATPAPITNGLTPIAEVKNITINSATLDGSKSQGAINYASWVMIKQPPGSDWNVFPNFDKSGLVKDLKNLAVGNYEFELTLKGPNGIAKTIVAFTVSQATPKPILTADIPQGKTKVTYLDNNTFSFS